MGQSGPFVCRNTKVCGDFSFLSILYWCDSRNNIIYPLSNTLTASSLHPLIRFISVPASIFADMIFFLRVEIMSVFFFCHDIVCFNPVVLSCNEPRFHYLSLWCLLHSYVHTYLSTIFFVFVLFFKFTLHFFIFNSSIYHFLIYCTV